MVGPSRIWREAPSRYRFLGNRCTVCEEVYFPPRQICPKCRRASIGRMEPIQLSGNGEVVTYTVVYDPAVGHELLTPYILAIVKLDEGPRVTSQIVGAGLSEIMIGSRVKTVLRKLREEKGGGEDGGSGDGSGVITYGYKFVLDGQS